jgi:hypothetical protein
MKTISAREFYHAPALITSLHAGQSLMVTDNGRPNFIVTKAGRRPRKTVADLEREAREIIPRKAPKTNYAKYLMSLKTR